MITLKLIAIEYLKPHAPLVNMVLQKIWWDWFTQHIFPQVTPWNVFIKNEGGVIHTCYIHWKRIEYKVENCIEKDIDNYNCDDLVNYVDILQDIRSNFYISEDQKVVELSWIILQVVFDADDQDQIAIKSVFSDKQLKNFDRQINYWEIKNEITLNYNILVWYDQGAQKISAQIDINDKYASNKPNIEIIRSSIKECLNKEFLLNLLLNKSN